MMDIAIAPDYGGFFVIIAIELVLYSVSIALVLQKMHFYREYAPRISSIVNSVMVLAVFLGLLVFVVKWLIKSLIVKYACDSESGWGFKNAVSFVGL